MNTQPQYDQKVYVHSGQNQRYQTGENDARRYREQQDRERQYRERQYRKDQYRTQQPQGQWDQGEQYRKSQYGAPQPRGQRDQNERYRKSQYGAPQPRGQREQKDEYRKRQYGTQRFGEQRDQTWRQQPQRSRNQRYEKRHSSESGTNRKRERRLVTTNRVLVILLVVVIAGAFVLLYLKDHSDTSIATALSISKPAQKVTIDEIKPDIDVELLTPNEYSRPQTTLDTVSNIVIHYTGNPGTTAIANRNYFEELKDDQTTYASSHFVVGLEGEIVQCIPTNEVAYASNEANAYCISIEVCHPDETGVFNTATYDSLVELTGWLCLYLNVDPDNVIRHYDVTGKLCPLYYVENESAWDAFKSDVASWVASYDVQPQE